MNCADCIEIMRELARSVLIEASKREVAFEHIESCESCRQRFALEEEMQVSLSALRDEDGSLRAPEAIKHNLIAAFREQQTATAANPRQTNRPWRFAIGAVAAVLLLLVGYGLWSGIPAGSNSRSTFVTPTPVTGASPQKASETEVAKIFGGTEQMRLSTDKPKKGKNRARAEKPEKPERPDKTAPVGNVSYELGEFNPITPRVELATDFIPLVAARGLPPSESGQVIRVSMPRSAMAYFGLPVPPEAPGQQISADVLVADDGLARAIRFVR